MNLEFDTPIINIGYRGVFVFRFFFRERRFPPCHWETPPKGQYIVQVSVHVFGFELCRLNGIYKNYHKMVYTYILL